MWLFSRFSSASEPDPRTDGGVEGPRFVQVAAGDAFLCAVGADGTVWCWGSNRSGELGGTSAEAFVARPAQLGLHGVVQLAAARHWAAAVRDDGSVWTWGRDGWGMRTGDPTAPPAGPAPTRVAGLDGVRQVALGELHGCALRNDGTVWCWGSDANGLLGDAARFEATSPPAPSPLGAPGPGPAGPSGGVRPPGSPPPPPLAPTDRRREPAFAPAPVPGLSGVTSVAAFGGRTAAVVDGEVWTWGRGAARVAREWGELGARPVTPDEVGPARVDGLSRVASVSLHRDHLVAVDVDGALFASGIVRQWWPRAGPPLVAGAAQAPVRYPDLAPVVEAVAFEGVAVRVDGGVRVWGAAPDARGDGTKGPAPSTVMRDAVSITAGRGFVAMVDRHGAVWGWGLGWAGQLGDVGGQPIGDGASWSVAAPVRIVGPTLR